MTHDPFAPASHWANTLRALVGFPGVAPIGTCLFATSSRLEGERVDRLADIAVDAGCDIVHIAFDDSEAPAPVVVSLLLGEFTTATWIEGVTLYAEGETAPISFLTDRSRWSVGESGRLTRGKLPPKQRRMRGEATAMRRWRDRFATTAPITLPGSRFVSRAAGLADDIPARIGN